MQRRSLYSHNRIGYSLETIHGINLHSNSLGVTCKKMIIHTKMNNFENEWLQLVLSIYYSLVSLNREIILLKCLQAHWKTLKAKYGTQESNNISYSIVVHGDNGFGLTRSDGLLNFNLYSMAF